MILKVQAKRDGFRRLGRAFSSTEPTYIKADTLSKEQIEALKSDPSLVVLETDKADDGKKTEADVGILKAQLEEAQKANSELVKEHGIALEAVEGLKKELAAEKDAHADTKKAAAKAAEAKPAAAAAAKPKSA